MLAESLRERISAGVYDYQNHQLKITLTFGVSIFSRRMQVEQCLKMADEALYEGKRQGKNCVAASHRVFGQKPNPTTVTSSCLSFSPLCSLKV